MAYKNSWRMFLPGAVTVVAWCMVVKFINVNQDTVKKGHDFVPIYGEDGKLQGFTHPVLVEAGDKAREKQEREGR